MKTILRQIPCSNLLPFRLHYLTEKCQCNVNPWNRKQHPQKNGHSICCVKNITRIRIETSTGFSSTVFWLTWKLHTEWCPNNSKPNPVDKFVRETIPFMSLSIFTGLWAEDSFNAALHHIEKNDRGKGTLEISANKIILREINSNDGVKNCPWDFIETRQSKGGKGHDRRCECKLEHS